RPGLGRGSGDHQLRDRDPGRWPTGATARRHRSRRSGFVRARNKLLSAAAGAAGLAAAGAAANAAADRVRHNRVRAEQGAGDFVPFGELRSQPLQVVADDGVDLYVEIDEPDTPGGGDGAADDLTIVFV